MFKKRFSLSTLIVCLLLAILFTFQITFVTMQLSYEQKLQQAKSAQSEDAAKLAMVADMLRTYCIYDVDPDLPADMALSAYLAASGDPYAKYYTPQEYQEMLRQDDGNQSGIGITVTDDKEGLRILTVVTASPAEKAGLLAGDRIVTVNGQALDALAYADKVDLLLGELDSEVRLAVLRDAQTKEYTLRRQAYETPAVTGYLLPDKKSALVRIHSFNNDTADQLRTLTAALVKQGARGFVYDLRDNPGGALTAVVEVLDYLLPAGTVVTLENYDGSKDVYTSDEKCFDYPCAILTNGSTASAAELFAACMRDYGAAFLVGEKTYGKGVAQSILALPDGSAVKITTAKYYSPKTKNYDGVGLKPDIVVKAPEDLTDFAHASYESDPQMQRAVKELWK